MKRILIILLGVLLTTSTAFAAISGGGGVGTARGGFTLSDDDWIGLGAAAGRIEFDDQATDEVNILGANVGIGTSTPGAEL